MAKKGLSREKLILTLKEGVSIEEVPNFTNLRELQIMVENSDLEPKVKSAMKKKISFLQKDSEKHSKAFGSLLSKVVKSKK